MTPDRLIPAALKPLTALASYDDTRSTMCGVHVTEDAHKRSLYEVTDGHHMLTRATVTTPLVPEDFPDVLPEIPGDPIVDVIIPRTAWDAAMRTVPTARQIGTTPILGAVACAIRGGAGPGDVRTILLATTDLNIKQVQQATAVDGTFPDTQHLYCTTPPLATVTLGVKLLERLLKTWGVLGADRVAIDVFAPDQPVQFSAETDDRAIHLSGLLMPMRPLPVSARMPVSAK